MKPLPPVEPKLPPRQVEVDGLTAVDGLFMVLVVALVFLLGGL